MGVWIAGAYKIRAVTFVPRRKSHILQLQLIFRRDSVRLSKKPGYDEETKMTTRPWQFLEIDNEGWFWVRNELNGTATRSGPFADLATCVKDAEVNGFEQSRLERRRFWRNQPRHERRCVGGA